MPNSRYMHLLLQMNRVLVHLVLSGGEARTVRAPCIFLI